MSSVEVLSMDLAVAVYPFILMLFSYFLVSLHDQNFKLLAFICNPFEILFSKWQSNFVFNTTTINTFAAFFNLSNIKFFSICFDMLTPVKVYQFYSPLQVNSSWRLYYDPTIKYFSQQHRWYSIIALVIAFVFIIIPLLVLLFYSTRKFIYGLTLDVAFFCYGAIIIIIFVIMTILIYPFKSTLKYLSSSILIFILLVA